MRIGISVISHAGQNIWENGMGQNVLFLARLLQRLDCVASVVLIDVGDQDALAPQVDLAELKLVRLTQQQATDAVDVVIELAGALDTQWLKLMRARGCKVVYYCCGQPYVGLIETSVFERGGHFSAPDRCDEVWLLPKDAVFEPMVRTLNRCPVYVVPYLWDPYFLQQRIKQVASISGVSYGYRPRAPGAGLKIAIFEPNISVVKTSTIAMLACDEAYRADASSVVMMHALNTLHMATHPTLLYLANSLDLVRQHKALFVGRHDIVGYMTQHADAVVAHQWQNSQNYSYLDVLYGNYPLVHNSPWLRDLGGAGYYYPEFDAQEGGRQIGLAHQTHDADLQGYKARSKVVFDAVDPSNEVNLNAYAQRLLQLCPDASVRATGVKK